jgi:cell wall-associated NlpC family hydrolase
LSFAVFGARRLALVFVAFFMAATLVPAASLTPAAPPAPVAAYTTQAGAVIGFAKNQLGKPWSLGAIGLRRYDCSGLVYRSFLEAGVLTKIGGNRKTAKGYYRWFKERGLASRTNPRIGDLVVWGYGSHIGIYIGDGKAVSTLSNGVKVHGVFAVTASFTAYLHVNIPR